MTQDSDSTVGITQKDSVVFNDNFGAQDYIRTYYPPILDVTKFLELSRIIHKEYELGPEVNIASLTHDTGSHHEMVENLALFDFQRVVARTLLETFPRGDANIFDVGGGPTIYQHIALSLSAEHITHSEFLRQNREEVLKWLNGEETAYDWDNYFELIKATLAEDIAYTSLLKELLSNSDPLIRSRAELIHEILFSKNSDLFKEHVRNIISNDVVFVDVFDSKFSYQEFPKLFDVVTANFVIEGATHDFKEWQKGMGYMMGHVKENGYLVVTAIKNAEWYQVGEARFPATALHEDHLKDICKEKGFKICHLRLLNGGNKERVGYESMIFMLAQKI